LCPIILIRRHMSDAELLEKAKNNDEKAFKEIIKKYKRPLHHMIFQIVNNSSVAEDLTMETFEKVFKDIKNFVPDYKLSTWIYQIGKNHAIDYKRVNGTKPRMVELDNMIKESLDPESQLISKEQSKRIEKAVGKLKGKYKDIVILRADGQSYQQISETLKIPINVISNYLHKSRQQILKELK